MAWKRCGDISSVSARECNGMGQCNIRVSIHMRLSDVVFENNEDG